MEKNEEYKKRFEENVPFRLDEWIKEWFPTESQSPEDTEVVRKPVIRKQVTGSVSERMTTGGGRILETTGSIQLTVEPSKRILPRIYTGTKIIIGNRSELEENPFEYDRSIAPLGLENDRGFSDLLRVHCKIQYDRLKPGVTLSLFISLYTCIYVNHPFTHLHLLLRV